MYSLTDVFTLHVRPLASPGFVKQTAAKFKPLIPSVYGLACNNDANICIFVVSYDVCSLSA
jgi:hypothetical protein